MISTTKNFLEYLLKSYRIRIHEFIKYIFYVFVEMTSNNRKHEAIIYKLHYLINYFTYMLYNFIIIIYML